MIAAVAALPNADITLGDAYALATGLADNRFDLCEIVRVHNEHRVHVELWFSVVLCFERSDRLIERAAELREGLGCNCFDDLRKRLARRVACCICKAIFEPAQVQFCENIQAHHRLAHAAHGLVQAVTQTREWAEAQHFHRREVIARRVVAHPCSPFVFVSRVEGSASWHSEDALACCFREFKAPAHVIAVNEDVGHHACLDDRVVFHEHAARRKIVAWEHASAVVIALVGWAPASVLAIDLAADFKGHAALWADEAAACCARALAIAHEGFDECTEALARDAHVTIEEPDEVGRFVVCCEAFSREHALHACVESSCAACVAAHAQVLVHHITWDGHSADGHWGRVVDKNDPQLDASQVELADVVHQLFDVFVLAKARRDRGDAPLDAFAPTDGLACPWVDGDCWLCFSLHAGQPAGIRERIGERGGGRRSVNRGGVLHGGGEYRDFAEVWGTAAMRKMQRFRKEAKAQTRHLHEHHERSSLRLRLFCSYRERSKFRYLLHVCGPYPLAMEMSVRLPGGQQRLAVVGSSERNLKLIRDALGVQIASRDGKITIAGSAAAVKAARRAMELLIDAAEASMPITRQFVLDVLSGQSEDVDREASDDASPAIGQAVGWQGRSEAFDDWGKGLNVYVAGKPVRPKTPNQAAYLRAVQQYDMVFGLGPAGTGKTYLAVAAAVHLLKDGAVRRVVLTRPAVEAGEKLGFLPGDLREKVNPYLRPLFDALNDMMDFATVRRFMENDVVEVCPLAFMRGRTLNQAIIILDEAQNCTKAQLKMFLTRMGHGSKVIVTGDPTQTDLPDGTQSGLLDAAMRLRKTEGVAFVGFEKTDVVRHDLVRRVIAAYEEE